jgi:hypothetical protein
MRVASTSIINMSVLSFVLFMADSMELDGGIVVKLISPSGVHSSEEIGAASGITVP